MRLANAGWSCKTVKTVFRFLILLLVAATSSCVFPTHLADEEPYRSQSIGFIVLNETTRTDVSSHLGPPVRIFSNGRWWVYQSDRRMTAWFLFIATPGGAGGGDVGGDTLIYSLIVEFGDDDVVSNLAVVTDQRPCTDDRTFCYAEGRLKVLDDSNSAAGTYDDQSSYSTLTDVQIQALRGEETARFSGTVCGGGEVELFESGGVFFVAGSMRPFTGCIMVLVVDGVGFVEQSLNAGTLYGPMIMRDGEGSVLMELPLDNETFVYFMEDGSSEDYSVKKENSSR